MKKLQILIIAFLILLSICVLESMQAKAQGTAVSISVSPAWASITAGNSETYTATATDAYGNSWDVTNSVTWSISSGAGGSWNNNVYTSATAGSWTVTADDGSCVTGAAYLTVTPASTVSIAVSPAWASITAGNSETYTATATDAYGNSWDVTNSVTWSISSGAGGSWNNNVYTSATAGSWTATADNSAGVIGTAYLTVTPGVLAQFVFSSIGSPQTAGTPFSVTIMAVDSYANTVTSYNGTPTLSDNSGTISPTITGDFVDGVWTGSVSVTQAGSDVITVIDTAGATGSSGDFMVDPAGLDHFVFSSISSPQTAGTPFIITVTAKDAYGNTVTSYTGTPSLKYSAGSISPITMNAFVSGIGSTSVTVTTAGSDVTLGVDDGNGNTGTSNPFTVSDAAAVSVTVSPSSATITAGNSETYMATASDAYGNTWDVTSSTSWSISPGAGGSWSSNVYTSQTAGSWTVSAIISGITGTAPLTVNAASAVSFVVSGFTETVTAGTAGSVTVTAKDAYGNTATGYTGTVKITSSDLAAFLPANAGLTGGVGSFSVTLKTVGSQSVTATDTVTSSITGSQSGITVNAAGAASFVVSGFPSPTIAGVAHTVTVTAYDAYGNVATGYAGTVKITSSDSQAVLPANSVLSSGVGSFSVTLKTAGTQSITVTDTVTSSITGLQNGITVSDAAAVGVTVSPSSATITAGNSETYMATASDAYGNTWDVTSSTSWSISSGAGGSWNNNIYTSAIAGSWRVTGTYVSTAYTADLTVIPASLDHFIFNTVATQTAGTPFIITVTAKDAYGNTVTSYTGTPSLKYSAGSISPITMNAFVSGIGSTSVTVTTAGSDVTITATDGIHTGMSNSFTMTTGPTPTPTPTPKPTPTPTPKPTPTPTPKPTPTPTASPSSFPTSSPIPASTSTPTATSSPTSTATPIPVSTPTPIPTATQTPSAKTPPAPVLGLALPAIVTVAIILILTLIALRRRRRKPVNKLPETVSLRNTIEKIKNLEEEKKNLLLEVEKLKKKAKAKATA